MTSARRLWCASDKSRWKGVGCTRSMGSAASRSPWPPSGSRYAARTQPPTASTFSATDASSAVMSMLQSFGSRPADFGVRLRRVARLAFAFACPAIYLLLYGGAVPLWRAPGQPLCSKAHNHPQNAARQHDLKVIMPAFLIAHGRHQEAQRRAHQQPRDDAPWHRVDLAREEARGDAGQNALERGADHDAHDLRCNLGIE